MAQVGICFVQTLVTSVRTTMISLQRPPNLPWGDHYGLELFKEGTSQHAIAEKAAEIYDQPNLALKGGFFYYLYYTKERISIPPKIRHNLSTICNTSWIAVQYL